MSTTFRSQRPIESSESSDEGPPPRASAQHRPPPAAARGRSAPAGGAASRRVSLVDAASLPASCVEVVALRGCGDLAIASRSTAKMLIGGHRHHVTTVTARSASDQAAAVALFVSGAAPPPVATPASAQALCSDTISLASFGAPASVRNLSSPRMSVASFPHSPSAVPRLPSTSGPRQHVVLDCGDEFFGETASVELQGQTHVVPHGQGTLQSASGQHCYVGAFAHRQREGKGKLVTTRFVLWCDWTANRPDFTRTARVDYPNGDRYSGYLKAVTNNHELAQMTAAAKQQQQKLDKALKAAKAAGSSASATSQSSAAFVSQASFVPPMTEQPLSKFSIWLASTTVVPSRWGELVSADGTRYFGQWVDGVRSGFGVLVLPCGHRYIGLFAGGKFHGKGTLMLHRAVEACTDCRRVAAAEEGIEAVLDQCQAADLLRHSVQGGGPSSRGNSPVPRLPLPGSPTATLPAQTPTSSSGSGGPPAAVAIPRPIATLPPDGTSFCGTWSNSTLTGEGTATLHDRTRIIGTFASLTKITDGRIVGPTLEERSRRWTEHLQWEPLLRGCDVASREKDFAEAAKARQKMRFAQGKTAFDGALLHVIRNNRTIQGALKVFRRCFFASFGTCGAPDEVGAGVANPAQLAHQDPNRPAVGWCRVRTTFSGCIHHVRGRRITSWDVEAALGDIFSLVASVRRYVEELLDEHEDEVADVDSAAIDKGLLPQPRFGTAMEAYSELEGDAALHREVFDAILAEVHDVLHNLYTHAFAAENRAVSVALQQLHGLTLDDLGVVFGRHHADERLFNPYAEAIRAVEGIGQHKTLSGKLADLRRWSQAIDAATRLAQVKLHDEQLQRIREESRTRHLAPPEPRLSTGQDDSSGGSMAESSRGGSDRDDINGSGSGAPRPQDSVIMRTMQRAVESGSADDLLPIHQYVLLCARIPDLLAHVKLMLDVTADSLLVDMTSQDSFCITTLQACVASIPQLDGDVRDHTGIVTPAAVFSKRAEDALMGAASLASDVWDFGPLRDAMALHLGLIPRPPALSAPLHRLPPAAAPLHTFDYVRRWVPGVLACLQASVADSAPAFHWRRQHVAHEHAKAARGKRRDHAMPEAALPPAPPPLFVLPSAVGITIEDITGPLLSSASPPELSAPRGLGPEGVLAVREAVYTQRIMGCTDSVEAMQQCMDQLAQRPKHVDPAATTSPAHPSMDLDVLAAAVKAAMADGRLSTDSGTLGRMEVLPVWLLSLTAAEQRAFDVGKMLGVAARCLAAADVHICLRDEGGDGCTPVCQRLPAKISRLEEAEACLAIGTRILRALTPADRPKDPAANAASSADAAGVSSSDADSDADVDEPLVVFVDHDDASLQGVNATTKAGPSPVTTALDDLLTIQLVVCHSGEVLRAVAGTLHRCDPRDRV